MLRLGFAHGPEDSKASKHCLILVRCSQELVPKPDLYKTMHLGLVSSKNAVSTRLCRKWAKALGRSNALLLKEIRVEICWLMLVNVGFLICFHDSSLEFNRFHGSLSGFIPLKTRFLTFRRPGLLQLCQLHLRSWRARTTWSIWSHLKIFLRPSRDLQTSL